MRHAPAFVEVGAAIGGRCVVLAARIAREITHDHIDGCGGVGDALDLQAYA